MPSISYSKNQVATGRISNRFVLTSQDARTATLQFSGNSSSKTRPSSGKGASWTDDSESKGERVFLVKEGYAESMHMTEKIRSSYLYKGVPEPMKSAREITTDMTLVR